MSESPLFGDFNRKRTFRFRPVPATPRLPLCANTRRRSPAECILEADISKVEDLGWNSFKI
jgi:hypothetical protein